MRYFYAVFVEDPFIETCLDAIRLILAPHEKRQAHITVRGPYSKKLDKSTIDQLSKLVEGQPIEIFGADKFFGDGQNTVVLRCRSPVLKEIWYKRDYDFNPHITIYDGHSRELAWKVFHILQAYRYSLIFPASRLLQIASVKGQEDMSIRLNLDTTLLHRIIGYRLRLRDIERMDASWRLFFTDRILSGLSSYSFSKRRNAARLH